MASLADLDRELRTMLGASAVFYPNGKPQLDDYYEAYLWAETLDAAATNWTVAHVNVGSGTDFTFRMGPGKLTSSAAYTYATLKRGPRRGELHVGIRIKGRSGVLHEFDVVGLSRSAADRCRMQGVQPDERDTRLHIEAKFHAADLSLGTGRSIIGLGMDCPSIHPFLVSRRQGSDTMRQLIKTYGGTYVHNGFSGDTGHPYLRVCLKAFLKRWHV